MCQEHDPKPKKDVRVLINAREVVVPHEKLSFERIVELAFGSYEEADGIAYTVSYSQGEDKQPKGVLIKGRFVMPKEGMIINVSKTNRS